MVNLNDISKFNEKVNKHLRDETKPWTWACDFIELQTGVDRLYVFWAVLVLITIFVVFDLAGNLICNFIAILYPAYSSIHAIESTNKDDDTKWLTYWVVFSIFSFAEYFINIILGWFPLYWLAKGLFFIWLMVPTSLNGSLFLYRTVIKPSFLEYHSTVEDAIKKAKNTASGIHITGENKEE